MRVISVVFVGRGVKFFGVFERILAGIFLGHLYIFSLVSAFKEVDALYQVRYPKKEVLFV